MTFDPWHLALGQKGQSLAALVLMLNIAGGSFFPNLEPESKREIQIPTQLGIFHIIFYCVWLVVDLQIILLP